MEWLGFTFMLLGIFAATSWLFKLIDWIERGERR